MSKNSDPVIIEELINLLKEETQYIYSLIFNPINPVEIEKYKNEMQNLSEDARSRREAFLMERQQNIQKKEYEWQQKIQTTQQELMSNIQSIVIEASKAVAKEEGYLYVFEKGSLVYAGGDNITDKVRKKLGINASN